MNAPNNFHIVPIDESLRRTVQPLIDDAWADPNIVINGKLWDTRAMPGFAALDAGGAVIGYLLYAFHDGLCEIMVLESLRRNAGIGTRLIEQTKELAKKHDIRKIVVVTTNDNISAIRFYQRRGFILRALRVNMLEISRKLKPEIPLAGGEGIPLRDEIEFEIEL